MYLCKKNNNKAKKKMKSITTIALNKIKVLTPNGFAHGFKTKRKATIREARYVLKNIFGIDINNQSDMFSVEDYKDYNNDLVNDFNNWLNGESDDSAIMSYAYDCSDESLGLFNAFKLAEYLQKRGII